MARADYVERVRSILYGSEIGEVPPIRLGAANANESVSGPTVTFTLATGDGVEVRAGDVLAVQNDTSASLCFAAYVRSVTSDTVTAINGYAGSPSVTGADSGDLDDAVMEQAPLVTTYKIHKAIDTIFATSLWPHVYKMGTKSVTPDLSTYQVELNAAVMDIEHAYQIIGSERFDIPYGVRRNAHTSISSTGVFGQFGFIDGSTAYLTTIEKLILGDEDEDANGLIEMVATGAAAVCLGATVSETDMARSSKDSQDRGQGDVAARLWRDFLTLRTNYEYGLSAEREDTIKVNRG